MWMQGQNSIEDIIEEKTHVLKGSNTGPSHYIVNDNKKPNLDLNRTQCKEVKLYSQVTVWNLFLRGSAVLFILNLY